MAVGVKLSDMTVTVLRHAEVMYFHTICLCKVMWPFNKRFTALDIEVTILPLQPLTNPNFDDVTRSIGLIPFPSPIAYTRY